MEEKNKPARKDSAKSPSSNEGDADSNFLKIASSPKGSLGVRSIESPKYGLGLSPIHRFMQTHSPGSMSPGLSPANRNKGVLNIDTLA